jgi:hypothetical protein
MVLAGAAMFAPPSLAKASPGGVDQSSAQPGSASASPLSLPGVLVVNGSSEATTSSNEEVLAVAGLNLLGNSGTRGGTINTGLLAAAGQIVAKLNQALCRKGVEANGFCLEVLFSNATKGTDSRFPGSTTTSASSAVAALTLGMFHLRLLGSSASGEVNGTKCSDLSTAYIVNTENAPKLPAGPGLGALPLQSTSTSINQPCPA